MRAFKLHKSPELFNFILPHLFMEGFRNASTFFFNECLLGASPLFLRLNPFESSAFIPRSRSCLNRIFSRHPKKKSSLYAEIHYIYFIY